MNSLTSFPSLPSVSWCAELPSTMTKRWQSLPNPISLGEDCLQSAQTTWSRIQMGYWLARSIAESPTACFATRLLADYGLITWLYGGPEQVVGAAGMAGGISLAGAGLITGNPFLWEAGLATAKFGTKSVVQGFLPWLD